MSDIKREAKRSVLDANKARIASILNGLKKRFILYKLTGEKSLEVDEVYAKKIKVKPFVNQQNSRSQYINID